MQMQTSNAGSSSSAKSRLRPILLVVIIAIALGVLHFSGFGELLLLTFLKARDVITSLFAILLASFHGARGWQLLRNKGLQAMATDDFLMFGPFGDVVLRGITTFAAFYTAFTVVALTLLGRMPSELPLAGYPVVVLSMFGIIGWCGKQVAIVWGAVTRDWEEGRHGRR